MGICVYLCMYVFRLFVQGLLLVEILASGSGSGTPLIQDIVTSNVGVWLSNATLRFFDLAELCPTYIFHSVSNFHVERSRTFKTIQNDKTSMV